MGHPDFRVNGRIFATLHADSRYGMVKLTPEQQQDLVATYPAMFAPENGAWGRQGCTRVTLASATRETVGEALTLAWRNVAQAPAKRTSAEVSTARSFPTKAVKARTSHRRKSK